MSIIKKNLAAINREYAEAQGSSTSAEQVRDRLLYASIKSTINDYDDDFAQLQELSQNALDSLSEKFESLSTEERQQYVPTIKFTFDHGQQTISCLDNGVGIDKAKFASLLLPNVSGKAGRKLPNRGEKGVAITFLTYGHSYFEMHSKHSSGVQSTVLDKGWEWASQIPPQIANVGFNPTKGIGPMPEFVFDDANIDSELDGYDSGVLVRLKLPAKRSNAHLIKRWDGFFVVSGPITEDSARQDIIFKRFELLLRTRTGIGFTRKHKLDPMSLEKEFWDKLRVDVVIVEKSTAPVQKQIKTGFLFPHQMVNTRNDCVQLLGVVGKTDLRLIWEDFEFSTLQTHGLSNKAAEEFVRGDNETVFNQYRTTGYFSYSHENQYYEKLLADYIHIDFKSFDQVRNSPVHSEHHLFKYFKDYCFNAGYMVGVKNFINGRLTNLPERVKQEFSSRVFLIFDFNGDYVPDTGRKTLRSDCVPLVAEISGVYASISRSYNGNMLHSTPGGGPHSAGDEDEAREHLLEKAIELRGHYSSGMRSGTGIAMPSVYFENDIVAEFALYVASGKLPGFNIYGFPPDFMFDGHYDYELDSNVHTLWDQNDNPLGVDFQKSKKLTRTQQWLEYKIDLQDLINEFDLLPGKPSKKYFRLLNLVVCERANPSTTSYTCTPVDASNVRERKVYGATHLLTSTAFPQHTIQVICLETLRQMVK